MSINSSRFQRALDVVHGLPVEEQRQLVEQLAQELDAGIAVTPLPLSGKWAGVSLSAEDIDEARRECWARLGDGE